MLFARRSRPAAGPAGDRGRLAERARAGDAAALATLRADLDPGSLEVLGGLLGVETAPLPVLAAAAGAAGETLAHVVAVLEQGGRSPALVAELLGRDLADVLAARESALAGSGQAAAPPGCRGWLLVAGGDRLTPAEQEAAQAHLAVCRRCTEARAVAAQADRRTSLPSPRPGTRA